MFGETNPESTDPWSAGDDSWEEVSVRESSAMLKTAVAAQRVEEGGYRVNCQNQEEEWTGDGAFKFGCRGGRAKGTCRSRSGDCVKTWVKGTRGLGPLGWY
jgi:hypothetical protein